MTDMTDLDNHSMGRSKIASLTDYLIKREFTPTYGIATAHPTPEARSFPSHAALLVTETHATEGNLQ